MDTAKHPNSTRRGRRACIAGPFPVTVAVLVLVMGLAIGQILVLGAALPGAAAFAHHSVPVNFDQSREVSVTGVLTEIKWLNPHSHFRMEVTNDDGSTVEWLVEMGAINTMRRAGFQTDRFSLGQLVTITGWPGRRDRVVYLNRAQMEDGTELLCLGARCNLTEEE